MPDARYRIRAMQLSDLETALSWAASEGWNPGRHDAASFHAADPGGFLVGLLDNAPIASISVVRYGRDYGFLGLYIVLPQHRGKGYGMALWNAGLALLGARAVGLDGVPAQQDNYRRSGFALAHRNIRYQGNAGTPQRNARPPAEITDLQRLPEPLLLAYDRPFFPSGRQDFLRAWTRQPGTHALGWLKNGRLQGYGVMRPCLSGHKIGPLFADCAEIAGHLLHALQARAPQGDAIFLDVPETNPHAVALAQHLGMTPMFETARMYKGAPALPDMPRTYGISSFELG